MSPNPFVKTASQVFGRYARANGAQDSSMKTIDAPSLPKEMSEEREEQRLNDKGFVLASVELHGVRPSEVRVC